MTSDEILGKYQAYWEALHENLSLDASSVTAALLTLTEVIQARDGFGSTTDKETD